ncbi:hypothetical protein [Streptomyces sp. NPDC090053]|uniref:hypothetical protein n=1 Tax=Streptomyces sp. NPDC090053 TaxID=3365932 RepID=UPI0038008E9F
MPLPRTSRRALRPVSALVSLLLAALPATTALSPPPDAPAAGPVPRTASAWLPYWDRENAYRDALRHAGQLHTVSPFWYRTAAADRIEGHPGAGDARIVAGLHRAGIDVVPTVMDMDTMKPGELAAILTTGWDWRADGTRPARHVTWKEAEALRRKVGAPYALDPASGTPHFTYDEGPVSRTVWYEDARGIGVQLAPLRKYGVRNTSLWALGFEDPGLWKVLARG